MQYGWTQAMAERTGGSIRWRGGTIDGLSTEAVGPTADAQTGELWALRVDKEPPWAFGFVGDAYRIEEASKP